MNRRPSSKWPLGYILLGVSIGFIIILLGGNIIQASVYQSRLMTQQSVDKLDVLTGLHTGVLSVKFLQMLYHPV